MRAVREGLALCVPGNHDIKLMRKLSGKNVQITHGLGETLEQREADDTEAVIRRQLLAVIDEIGIAAFADAVVAYEPVWAIGTGRTASPDQAAEVHTFIRGLVADRDGQVAEGLRILYGGSVKGDNAPGLFARKDIDGGLIGGASLQAAEFLAIGRAAAGAE